MLYLNVKLTFVQMYNLGIHLGHTMDVSKFLSFWIYGGWRSNLFIINLIKTRLMLKNIIDSIQAIVLYKRPFWYINLDQRRGVYINRYAILAGEPYVSYYWINGTLTNFRSIFGWYKILYKLLKSTKYRMRHRDKNKLLNYFGFLNNRRHFPGLGFVSSTLTSWKAVSEFWTLTIPCAAVVDSNVLSWNVSLPIPGNDDSLLCLNYYCFIITRNIIFSKSYSIWKFSHLVKERKVDKIYAIQLKKKLLLTFLYKRKKQQEIDELLEKFKATHYDYVSPVDKIKWNFKHMMFDMTIFNTEYSVFRNYGFFNFFGISFSEYFQSNKDLIFSNDPYRIY